MAINTTIKVLGAAVAFAIAGQVSAEGNRYGQPRFYQSEMSVAQAYLAMEHSKDFKNVAGQAKPVLIDVRTLREYASGHPEDAYNVPFPNIYIKDDQDPVKFYWMVHDLVSGNMDAPIMLLCRTGNRSIRAGNILANPEGFIPDSLGVGLEKFTNVRNIWEGYVGLYLYEFESGLPVPTKPLDLNNNDIIDADYADVFAQVADANPDKDGWRNFAGLPWTTQIQKPLAYERDPGLYKALNLTPVE